MAPVTAEQAQTEARALREGAREHKRAAASHRKQAKDKMRRLARLEATCRQFGIALVIDELAVEELDLPDGALAREAALQQSIHTPHSPTGRQSERSDQANT